MEKLNDWKVYEHAIQVLCNDERKREIYKRKYGQYMTAETPVIKKLAEKRNEAFNRQFGFETSEDICGSDYYVGELCYSYKMVGNAFHPQTRLVTQWAGSEKTKDLYYCPGYELSEEEFPLGHFSDNYGVANPKYMFGGQAYMGRFKWFQDKCAKGNKELFLTQHNLYRYENGKFIPKVDW